jgi:putative component of toxin-antitoxin plasmid stabilization module
VSEVQRTDVFAEWLDGLRDRVYFMKRGRELIILLAGGDKSTQAEDIGTALHLARNL